MNALQRALLDVYAGGEFRDLADGEVEDCYDTLLLFLYRKLSDVTTQEEANDRMAMALRDITHVAEHIGRLDS